MISSSPTALITMHNVKRFLQEAVFEPSQDARARAAAEGNARPEDLIAIYRKRTTIDPSGRETESHLRYASCLNMGHRQYGIDAISGTSL